MLDFIVMQMSIVNREKGYYVQKQCTLIAYSTYVVIVGEFNCKTMREASKRIH